MTVLADEDDNVLFRIHSAALGSNEHEVVTFKRVSYALNGIRLKVTISCLSYIGERTHRLSLVLT